MTVKVGSASSWISSALTSSGPHAAWRSPWSIAPTPNSSARWNSPCATRPTTWPPPPTRPALRAGKRGCQGCSIACPDCGRPAQFIDYLSRTLLTVNGEVDLSRAYYYGGPCRGGHCPWDRMLGLDGGRQSPAVQSLTALAGALEPFGRADDRLRRLAGLRLSASTCRRVTEGAGDALRQRHRDGEPVRAERPAAWDFTLPDQDGQSFSGTVAYLGLDAFAVPTRRGGGVDWRMLYVGLWYDPRKGHTVYLSDFEVVANWMRRCAVACGLGVAETLVALTDGGNGLERVLRQAFSEAVVFVLDYYHAAERLHAFGGLLHGHDPGAARAWAEEAKGVLWERGGRDLRDWLRGLRLPRKATEELREGLRGLLGYVQSNVHRMDYPAYRARGWDVGSGPTEAGCKVLGGRLKGAGCAGAHRHRNKWRRCGRCTPAATGYGTPSGTNAVGKTTKGSERLPVRLSILDLARPAVNGGPTRRSPVNRAARDFSPVYGASA